MVSSFSVEVTLPIPADVLWRVRASRPFMDFLVRNGALSRMEASSARQVPSHPNLYTRRQTYVPAEIAIPDIIKPMLDDSYIEVTDTQTWNDVARPLEQRFRITPSILGDVVKTHGVLVLRPMGKEKMCSHVLEGECQVGIPFLGWYVEQAIIANMRNFYEEYPRHIEEFVQMVVDRWGNGKVDSLKVAVEKMLAEDKMKA